MKKTVALTVSAVVLAVAMATLAYFILVQSGGLPDDPLLLAPEDTAILVRVDVDAVKRSAVFGKLVTERGLDAGLSELAEECGYDLIGSLSQLFLFVRPEGERNSVALVGSGRIDPGATSKCMRMRMKESGIELEDTTLAGFPALTHSTITARVAFVGEKAVVMGDEPMVIAVLDRIRGEIPRIDPKSHISVLYERMRPGRDLVVAAELPENWHRAARGVLSPEQAYQLTPSLMHLHEAGLGVSLRDGLSMGAVLRFDEESEAQKASDTIEATLENMKKNVFLSLTPAGPAISAVKVERGEDEVRLGLTLTEQQVGDLLRVAKALEEDTEAK